MRLVHTQMVINRKCKMSKLIIISGLSKLFSALLPHLDQNDHVTEGGGGLSRLYQERPCFKYM